MKSSLRKILIGGGTGFIGSALRSLLKNQGYIVTVISRKPGNETITWEDISKNGIPENTHAIINLAGENVLNPAKRWNDDFKQKIMESRINTTTLLANAIQSTTKKPKVFVSMSGVGIYKPDPEKIYDEYTNIGSSFDFISELVHKWEEASKTSTNVRRVILRSGVVLGRNGGMIKEIYPSFNFCIGGRIGSGKQYFPWIHQYDICKLIIFAIENENVTGIINGVSPQIITNVQFTKTFAKALRRFAILPLPKFVVHLIFGRERGVMLLEGQQVIPKKVVEEYNFKYLYPTIDVACEELVRNKHTTSSVDN